MSALHFEQFKSQNDRGFLPLLIAHGLFGQGRNFTTLARAFSANRDVITVDMRNHGKSPWFDTMQYSDMAEDLAGIIEELGVPKASVLGHSMGGKAVMMLCAKRPELLASAIIADIAPIAYSHSYTQMIEGMLAIDLSTMKNRRDVDTALKPTVRDNATRAFLLQNIEFEGGKAAWRANLRVLLTHLPEIVGWPDGITAGSLPFPMLGLRGGKSSYMQDDGETAFRDLFPNAALETIPNAGHWLHADSRDAFTSAVESFLSAQGL